MQSNDQYRANAERIEAEYACYNAPQVAATLLEQLAVTRQPVLRDTQLTSKPVLQRKPFQERSARGRSMRQRLPAALDTLY
ncbi:hypothetical protein HC891_14320 [Candidatus Gracilibacteria bacterium]|nr:hypothetical protein [Candidatus Gracilibacteria bacterium]